MNCNLINKSLKSSDSQGAATLRLLLRQSSRELTEKLFKALPKSLFQLDVVNTGSELAEAIDRDDIDVVLLDMSAPTMENKRSFDAVRGGSIPPPVIVYGDTTSSDTMINFIKHGAHAMFLVDEDADIIINSVRQAARVHHLARENIRLQESIFSKRKTIDILERFGEAMSTVFDVGKILNLTLRVARRALDCEVCSLFLVDNDTGELVDSRDVEFEGDHPQLELWIAGGKDRGRLLKGAAELTIENGRALHLNRSEDILALEGDVELPPEEGGLSNLLTAPLLVKGRSLGVLVVANRLGCPDFTGDDDDILLSIARQTAFALAGIRSLENEGSFQEQLGEQVQATTTKLKERNFLLQKRLEEKTDANDKIKTMAAEIKDKNSSLKDMIEQFKVIHEISQVIGSELENETLIKKIISETASLLRAETVSIMLKDTEGSLTIRHAVGLSAEVIKNTRVKPGEGISGWVAEEGKPILVRDVKSIRKDLPDITRYHSDSLLCVPLKIKGQVSGVLNVTNRDGGGSFGEKDLFLLTILGSHASTAIENAKLYGTIRDNYFNTIKALVNAVEAKDSWTKDHSENVTNYSLKIADFLGLSDDQKEIIRYAGVLHDIGKIVISSTITDKPDSLSNEEWEVIREHPLIGQRILDPIDFLEPVKICIQTHHERCDGSGYPFGLKAHEIPLETRILSVADAYDAMVHSRPYREALTVQDAVTELKRSSGAQFDPAVVDGLVRIIEAEGLLSGPEQ